MHTFRSDFFSKRLTFWHDLNDFRLDVLQSAMRSSKARLLWSVSFSCRKKCTRQQQWEHAKLRHALWRQKLASFRVMFDKTHCDRRSNNDWQDPLLVLVDEYLVDFLLKDDGVVEHCLRSCPRQVQEVELETFTSRSWSKGEWTDGRDTCVCSGRVLFSAGSKRPLSQDCDHELRQGDLAKPHH